MDTLVPTPPQEQQVAEDVLYALRCLLNLLQGLDWDIGAIGTATWSGVRLRDVLTAAGRLIREQPNSRWHQGHCDSSARHDGSLFRVRILDQTRSWYSFHTQAWTLMTLRCHTSTSLVLTLTRYQVGKQVPLTACNRVPSALCHPCCAQMHMCNAHQLVWTSSSYGR
jgi:hypothetical protein